MALGKIGLLPPCSPSSLYFHPSGINGKPPSSSVASVWWQRWKKYFKHGARFWPKGESKTYFSLGHAKEPGDSKI